MGMEWFHSSVDTVIPLVVLMEEMVAMEVMSYSEVNRLL